MAQEKKGPVTQLKEQFDEKSAACKNLQEEYLRAVADFDNLRKRTERDSEVSRRLALEAFVLDLVPVLDNFERALQTAGEGAGAESLKKGIDLIHRQLRETLCKHGVEEYSCAGTQFDPRRAEAISFVHTEEQEPGTVVSEICKGYACGERVLRPARVVVAKAGRTNQNSETRDQNSERRDSEGATRKPSGAGQEPEAEAAEIEGSVSESNG
ncbi:MAG TPA: nucleotide exchange factor GrpE [bacterium]|nr:nucleotide exchange factor GrpE [bacterium]